MKMKKVLSSFLAGTIFVTSFSILGQSESVSAATVNSIPNTTRSIKEYDKSFMSLTGYASVNIGSAQRQPNVCVRSLRIKLQIRSSRDSATVCSITCLLYTSRCV